MSLRILVVDDSQVMRKMVIRVLGMSGLPIASIHEACQGREALDLLTRERDINLGLFDVNMLVLNVKGWWCRSAPSLGPKPCPW